MPFRENPFPGLRPFQPDDADFYFGRDTQREELLARLRTHRFLAVVGSSGSGKSSLVRAGLIPDLRKGYLEKGGPGWRIIMFSPGSTPFTELASSLVKIFPDCKQEAVLQTVQFSSSGLNRFVQQNLDTGSENLLIVVDQFEELIRYSSEEASAFVRTILASTGQERLYDPESENVRVSGSIPIYIVLTMRSDFLGKCSRFRGLPESLNDNQYLVPRLTRDEQREAIESPIAMAGGKITPRLVQRLLNDVGDNPDQLPVLQHALMRTWEEAKSARAKGDAIDVGHYQNTGGMQEALNRDANEAFAELKGNLRLETIAEKVFQRLVEPGSIDEESRRPTPLSELVEVCKDGQSAVTQNDKDEVLGVVKVFEKRGFLTVSNAPDPVIDIPHESLIRLWGRLREWVKEERKSAETYLGLVKGSSEGLGVHRGVALLVALNWRQQQQPNQVWANRYSGERPGSFSQALRFLDRSRRAARIRKLSAILGVAAVGFALFIAAVLERNNVRVTKALLTQTDIAKQRSEQLLKNSNFANQRLNDANQRLEDAVKTADLEKQRTQRALKVADLERLGEERALALARSETVRRQNALDLATSRGKTDELYREGIRKYLSGDQAGAIANFTEALGYYKKNENSQAVAQTLVNIGMANAAQKKIPEAIQNLQEAMPLYDQFGNDPKGKAGALTQLGDLYTKLIPDKTSYGLGSDESARADEQDTLQIRSNAIEAYQEALNIFQQASDPASVGNVASKIAQVYKAALKGPTGHLTAASGTAVSGEIEVRGKLLEIQKVYLAVYPSLPKPRLLQKASLLIELADNLAAMNKQTEALATYVEAKDLYQQAGNFRGIVTSYNKIGISLGASDPRYDRLSSEVEDYFSGGTAKDAKDPFYSSASQIANFYHATGNPRKALGFFHRAIEFDTQTLRLSVTSPLYTRVIELEQSVGNSDVATDAALTFNLYIRSGIYPPYTRERLSRSFNEFIGKQKNGREGVIGRYEERLADARKTKDKTSEARHTLLLCTLGQGENGNLSECYHRAWPIYLESRDHQGQMILLFLMANSAADAKNWDLATTNYQKLQSYEVQAGSPAAARIIMLEGLAESLEGQKAYDFAVDAYLKAAAVYKTCGFAHGEALDYYQAGGVLDEEGNYKAAIEYYKRADTTMTSDDFFWRKTGILPALENDYDKLGDRENSKKTKDLISNMIEDDSSR
jgi:tetratricopeptide (TPR) repeat protein